ncbi:rod shape-determining protein MreD [Agrilactobacillus fermenti]|uniref:rod shape-determining protein MreD n=1 Tax=Agrilactobacillus fermenti TaxID=2586909 RepID=UPI001E414B2A|nr:rod shape-determining protein MreD [Agrilactobacillus fermenti]MCD2256484.1 rod shape-determining protein MreD [Agrilactobacillus fermenti]
MTIAAKRLRWFIPIIWTVLFLLDGTISLLFQKWLYHDFLNISSQVLLMGVVSTSFHFDTERWLIWPAFVIGIFYDCFYLGIVGYYTFLLPMVVMIVRWIADYLPDSMLFQAVTYILMLIILEFALFILNSFFGDGIGFFTFVSTDLGPTLAANVIVFLLIYYPYKQLMKAISN